MPTELDLILRLGAAALLGGAVGLEREISDQPAGFRTHILVALGSCLFAIISAYGYEAFLGDQPGQVRFDPSRLSAQIVSGIGFLGAGAILRYGATVRGLTTAASLWVVAAIGLAVSLGAYLLASVTTAITVVSLWGLKHVRRVLVRGLKPEHEEFTLELTGDGRLEDVLAALSEKDVALRHVRLDEEEGAQVVSLFLKLGPREQPEDVAGILSGLPQVRTVDWTR